MIRWSIIEADIPQLLHSQRDASVALRNFLLNQRSDITAELLNTFIFTALDYPHWQQNRSELTQEIKSFLVKIGSEDYAKDIFWPENIQVVTLQNSQDHIDCVKSFLKSRYRGQDYKVSNGPNKNILGLIKTEDSFIVHQFSNRFWICQGQLVPLRQDLQLTYDLNLNLKEGVQQGLELSAHVDGFFNIHGMRLNGYLTRGYLFQKFLDLKEATFYSYPKLVFALKTIEQFFVDKESDPFYTDMIGNLERCIRLLQRGDKQILEEIHEIIAFAQSAREFVFPDDKILEILLKEVRTLTSQHSSQVAENKGNSYGSNSTQQSYRRQRSDIQT